MKRFLQIITIIILATSGLKAQFIDDALRYAVPNGMITPRTAALNVSYHGVSDDIGALMYNPAGLTIPEFGEFSIGLGFTRNSIESNFLGYKDLLNSNSEYLSHLGFNIPFKMGEHKASIGIAYFNESNFDKDMRFEGFNPGKSFIYYNNDMAKYLNLADSAHYTPIKDSLYQNAFIKESGGLHNISGAMAFDLNRFVSFGFGIVGKWGTFNYTKDYTEHDTLNKYRTYDTNYSDVDFTKLYVDESITANISGFSAMFAVQSRIFDFMRVGMTIKLPTWYQVDETFSQQGVAKFDNGDSTKNEYKNEGNTSYSIRTPFIYSAGLSLHKYGFTLTAGLEYTDVSQLEFTESTPEIQKLNLQIVQALVGQVTWGIGAEYQVPSIPLVLRGSYAQLTSPYKENIPNANLAMTSFGASVYVGDNIRLDAVCRFKRISELRSNYPGSSFTFDSKPIDFGLGFTYRY